MEVKLWTKALACQTLLWTHTEGILRCVKDSLRTHEPKIRHGDDIRNLQSYRGLDKFSHPHGMCHVDDIGIFLSQDAFRKLANSRILQIISEARGICLILEGKYFYA